MVGKEEHNARDIEICEGEQRSFVFDVALESMSRRFTMPRDFLYSPMMNGTSAISALSGNCSGGIVTSVPSARVMNGIATPCGPNNSQLSQKKSNNHTRTVYPTRVGALFAAISNSRVDTVRRQARLSLSSEHPT